MTDAVASYEREMRSDAPTVAWEDEMEERTMRCAGFPQRGGCDGKPGGKNPYWCDDCNEKRMAHLSKRFEELAHAFEAKP